MKESDVLSTMTLKFVVEGATVAEVAVNTLTEAQQKQVSSALALANQTDALARRQTSAAAAMDAMAKKMDPSIRAMAELEKNQNIFNRALANNASVTDRAGQGLDVYRAKLNEQRMAVEALVRQQEILASQQRAAAAAPVRIQDAIDKSLGIGGVAAPSSAKASASSFFSQQDIAAANEQAAALARVRAEMRPLEAEQGKLGAQMAMYRTWVKEGSMTANEFNHAQDTAGKRLQDFAQNLRVAGTAGRVMSGEMTNLGFQLNDVVTGLALGQSPFMILAQQGGQIIQIFTSSKASIADFARSSIAWFTSLFTAGRVAFGGIAGAAIAAGFAVASYASSQREAAQALIGVGQRSGTTVAQINEFAKANASATGLSVDQARTVAIEFAKTGNIAVSGLQGVGDAIHGFSVLAGQDASEATKTFAQAFSGTAVQAAEQFNKTYGFLNASTREYIKNLEMQGDRTKAFQVIIDAIARDNLKAAESTSGWAKAWDMLSNAASRAKNAVGAVLTESSDAELQRLTRRRERQPDAITPRENRRIQELTKDANDFSAGAIVKQFAQWSLAADDVVKSTIPQIAKLEELKKAEMALVLGRDRNDPKTDTALTINRNQQAAITEAEAEAARYNERIKEISQSWGEVGQSTALSLQSSENQLPVARAVGGAAKMAAQNVADFAEAMDKGKSATEAAALAAARLAASQAQVNSSARETLFSLQNQAAASAAVSGAQQIRAQSQATYNQLVHDGVDATLAEAVAAQEVANARAKASAAVKEQIHSLEQSTEMMIAQQNGTEATAAAAQAYENAMRAGASATEAAALSAATLTNELMKASVQAQKAEQAQIEAIARQPPRSEFQPTIMPSGPLTFGMDPWRSGGGDIDLGQSAIRLLMMQAEQEKLGVSGTADSAYGTGGISAALTSVTGASNTSGISFTDAQLLKGRTNTIDAMSILGAQQSTMDAKMSTYDSLVQLQNAQTNDKSIQISNLQSEMAWLNTLPETIARDQKIVSLQQSIDQLKNATDANTAATSATLNPLYSQGHGALAIGYYKAAGGMEGIVGGHGGTDSTEVRMMLTPGEHIKVTPQGQANDNSRQTTIVQNFYGQSTSNQRRSRRQAQQGFAQSMAAIG